MSGTGLSEPEDMDKLPAELQDEIRKYLSEGNSEDARGAKPDLPQIKVLHAGAQSFRIGDEAPVVEFKGIVVHSHIAHAWWEKPMGHGDGGGGDMPDCFSLDGLKPAPEGKLVQASECAPCPLNQFGSDIKPDGSAGRGKACKNMRRIYVLLPGRSLPCRMTLPPTSLKAWTNYVVHVADLKKTRVGLVWTRFVAVGGKNVDGIDYTQTQFTFDRMISTSEAPGVLKAMKDVKEYASRPIMAAEYVSSKE